MKLDPGARRALEALASRLREQLGLPEPADERLLQGDIASAVGGVFGGARKMKGLGQHLLGDLGRRMARSVTVFAVAGLDLTDGDTVAFPARLGARVVLGRLDDETEAELGRFARDFVGRPLRFTDDAW